MRTRTLAFTTAAMLMGTSSLANPFTDAIVADFQKNGYDFIEVKEGPNQVKAEGVRGRQKLEIIYDRSTGRILKQEVEAADADEIGRTGVQFDTEDKDFLNDDEDDDENDFEDDENDEDDPEDDEDDEGDHDENDEDDDEDDEDDDEDDDDDDDDEGEDGGDDDDDEDDD